MDTENNVIDFYEYKTKKWDGWVELDGVREITISDQDDKFLIQFVYKNNEKLTLSLEEEPRDKFFARCVAIVKNIPYQLVTHFKNPDFKPME